GPLVQTTLALTGPDPGNSTSMTSCTDSSAAPASISNPHCEMSRITTGRSPALVDAVATESVSAVRFGPRRLTRSAISLEKLDFPSCDCRRTAWTCISLPLKAGHEQDLLRTGLP